jgi:hypothetical protein
MRNYVALGAMIAGMVVLGAAPLAAEKAEPGSTASIEALLDKGSYAEAEKLLRSIEADAAAPGRAKAARQLELLRRTRMEFNVDAATVLRQIRQSVPDATETDVDHWRAEGVLQHRVIDGAPLYFREAAANLLRLSPQARSRRSVEPKPRKKFDLDGHLRELVRLADGSPSAEIYPVHHRVRFQLTVNEGLPELKAGAKVRAWLPFPQEYRQQRDVKLIAADPPGAQVTENGAPHRALHFETTLADPPKAPKFSADFEFVTSAYCPSLDAERVQPYDTSSSLYREFTAQRPPHIVFTPQVKQLAHQIVGAETNPLEKARLIFRWVSQNIPWVSEMEYCVIPNLSDKGLSARCGDCGVQGMTFITLCRAAGVPARWQSGWQTKTPDWNMHDWSEFYVEPWGWLPADASYGLRDDADPRVRDFFCGHMDPYRMIVNLDYARPLQPPKTNLRSEPNDFQRGEVEIDGENLYFDQWDWTFKVETRPLAEPQPSDRGGKDAAS